MPFLKTLKTLKPDNCCRVPPCRVPPYPICVFIVCAVFAGSFITPIVPLSCLGLICMSVIYCKMKK